ncbi:MAG: M48 family metalloprotease [Proteobacteria bacterium]|nr:M48 family metalloprotease [Pseudomonadota bacterium]
MFTNFIYFIIVILIYSTYQYSGSANDASFSEVLYIFFSLSAIFIYFIFSRFRRLEKSISYQNQFLYYHKFDSFLNTSSILAILLFAINIYGLNLPSYTGNMPLFKSVPTVEALLFLCLFLLYLSIIWGSAFGAYKKLYYADDLSRRSYIASNISFSIPVVMPWLLLSFAADIINLLPFDGPKRFLSTTGGELIFFISFLIIIAIFGPVLIQTFWRCTPVEEGKNRAMIEAVCKRAGVKISNILYWPIFGTRMITAGVMGLVSRFRYLLVTKALLSLLEPEEVEAVIAHEIGHIKRKHLLFYLVFFLGYMLLSLATFDMIIYLVIYAKPFYRFLTDYGVKQATVISISFGITITALFLVYFRFIFGYFMRNFERQADIYVYSFFDSAKALISTLEKIAFASGQPADKPNWHHFSIKERIEYLNRCDADKTWIKRHNIKIKKSMAVYLAGLLIIGSVGYNLNFGEKGKRINEYFIEKIVLGEIQNNPNNPDLHAMLGDFYYSIKEFHKAKKAYENALSIDRDNPKVLNNLAWLYATCEDESIRNAAMAVTLAKRTVRIEEKPHFYDTLAESYYATGEYKEAVEAARKALALAASDKSYYEKQLNRFLKHQN